MIDPSERRGDFWKQLWAGIWSRGFARYLTTAGALAWIGLWFAGEIWVLMLAALLAIWLHKKVPWLKD